jgi:hypothetical protein
MKRVEHNYGARLYLKFVLNILKVTREELAPFIKYLKIIYNISNILKDLKIFQTNSKYLKIFEGIFLDKI